MFSFPANVVKFLSGLLKALPIIVVVVICLFIATKLESCGVFGPSKEELKAQVANKDAVITEVQKANTDLAATSVEIKKSGDIDLKVVEATAAKDKVIVKKKLFRENKVKSDVQAVDIAHASEHQTPETQAQIQLEKSTIQINAIWDAYDAATKVNEVKT